MSNNMQVRDGNNNLVTIVTTDVGSGVELPQQLPTFQNASGGQDKAVSCIGKPAGTQAVGINGNTFSDLARNLNSAATTTVELTTSAAELQNASSLYVEFDTAAGTGTTPTLDVYIQESADGTNWNDRIHFTQATTSASKQAAGITCQASLAVTAFADGTMAAATILNGPFAGRLRIKYVVGGTSPVFNPVNVRVIAR